MLNETHHKTQDNENVDTEKEKRCKVEISVPAQTGGEWNGLHLFKPLFSLSLFAEPIKINYEKCFSHIIRSEVQNASAVRAKNTFLFISVICDSPDIFILGENFF